MKIDVVEQLGATAFVHGKIGTDTALLVEARASRPKAGDMLTGPFDPPFIYLCAEDGARIR
jgi:lactose/L-arabinose transport system ATP-binding protein